MTFIDDPRKWRISMDGYTIKTGWADEKKLIAKYPYALSPIDSKLFQEWLATAEQICTLHNMVLDPPSYDPKKSQWAADKHCCHCGAEFDYVLGWQDLKPGLMCRKCALANHVGTSEKCGQCFPATL